MISAPFADPDGDASGSVYLVFGRNAVGAAEIDLASLDGSDGFRLDGSVAGAHAGGHLAAVGDVNGDGYDDVAIAVDTTAEASGASVYLLFGRAGGFDATIDLAALDARQGLRFDGLSGGPGEMLASVAAAGDLNGDGLDDVAIGDGRATVGALTDAGSVYVVYGRNFTGHITQKGDDGGGILVGTGADESLVGGALADLLNGAGGVDVLRGGAGNDVLVWDPIDRRIDGGDGTDTLRIDGGGINLDLTTIPAERLSGIEIIDLTGSGNNQVQLDLYALLALGEGTRLRIDGNLGDSVLVDGVDAWIPVGNSVIDGKGYLHYGYPEGQHVNALLLIEDGVGSNFPPV